MPCVWTRILRTCRKIALLLRLYEAQGTISLADPKRTQLSVRREQAVLVGVLLPGQRGEWPDPLAELAALATAAGARVVDRLIQKRSRIDPALYIGRGKAGQVADRVNLHDADVIIFDNDLSPGQIGGLEDHTKTKVIDRSELILDIFATRAQTREARLQVELAQLQYTYPRLTRMWSHLDRLEGGGALGIGTRGPGEQQLEIDRRLVQKRLADLRQKIKQIQQRKSRQVHTRADQFTISLVGYTNAGKSTLMNALTGAGTKVEDKLFATLDTKTRRWDLGDGQVALLSDTVGFVRDLPHHLVASFRATLEEATHAELLIHVVDASNPQVMQQCDAVENVLGELDCQDSRRLTVLNKTDMEADRIQRTLLEQRYPGALKISAATGRGLTDLIGAVYQVCAGSTLELNVRVHSGAGKALSYLAEHGNVLERTYEDEYVRLRVLLSKHDHEAIRRNEIWKNIEYLDLAAEGS